jgi:hypothetical protein
VTGPVGSESWTDHSHISRDLLILHSADRRRAPPGKTAMSEESIWGSVSLELLDLDQILATDVGVPEDEEVVRVHVCRAT